MITKPFAPRMLIACGVSFCALFASAQGVVLEKVAQIQVAKATEIVCYDHSTQRAVLTIKETPEVAVIAIDENGEPSIERRISFADVGEVVNSVAAHEGLFAAAVEPRESTEPGTVVFFDVHGNRLHESRVGPMPDMETFTHDGSMLLVANEGVPNDAGTIDPPGSVSIIDINAGYAVRTLLLGSDHPSKRQGWFTMPGNLAPEMVEPEYITISPDSTRAYVVCQENNAVFELDLLDPRIIERHWLGMVEWGSNGASIDLDPEDGVLKPASNFVSSLRQPDGIISFGTSNGLRLVTANEGDPRDEWGDDGMKKQSGVQVVQSSDQPRNTPVIFGSRGVTLFDGHLKPLYDSADTLEQSIALLYKTGRISDEIMEAIDKRSGKRGIEPESIATGMIDGRRLVFVGLERAGMIAVFEYDEERDSLTHLSTCSVGVMPGQEPAIVSPEGLAFVGLNSSAAEFPLLIVCDELHGTLSILSVSFD